ncbi:hypothetical protein A3H85_02465 [Candidatus Daviesbacteria bacterium RIFCSPLOWO2_02_FULL_40_8]|uniref:Uncharacterized protein n=1 Tax=Candidatus Daviesbacteria bacterium RIFCSPLOWO2_01_FULL_40_24 TaxID=1797787 RepID=A0A1F5MID3_9BACT|nr:MAG: hypothetical protein A2780_01175 [Candidatus Daviesbacteria bacterium RIFCSPHIGHO2_01_FULL_41_45]OGE33963.1 MAG: hypothetical protein A3C32_01145 [Candidatus Daviesbacteria bacterium RIFCSPHIGHO2_02_FULL_41_14]OGE65136.1 MAG: hypothetical protein A3B49_03140 [Candidatus Daviesbacteria bacterium RIFCSPLOWO2_01_FULL_40_24]OGE67010.1 MAG: hypothetical protein A3H85_02465 [Candidatus Daviesbacteria bacterium RIFCSPLOWO2_02_FULL_40_8]
MKGFKPLTLKEIKKRHSKNTQDKDLHKIIENNTINKKIFKKLIGESVKDRPFDKKNISTVTKPKV